MIYDIHVHIWGTGSRHGDNTILKSYRASKTYAKVLQKLAFPPDAGDWYEFDESYMEKVLGYLKTSVVNRAVLLGMDFAYLRDSTRDIDHSLISAGHDYLCEVAASNEKLLFAGSVHPYRPDALQELEAIIKHGACLVHWLPVAQNIRADDPICFPYYEMLAHYKVPLLCHCGGEDSLRMYSDELGNPKLLIPALERGVTVIAGHCGTQFKFGGLNYFEAWKEMALKYEHFYGDLSSFYTLARLWPLGTMIETPELESKLLFGSDFPYWEVPWPLAGQLGYCEVKDLQAMTNPFDQAVQTLRSFGVPEDVFSRAETVLRILPKTIVSTPKNEAPKQ